MDRGESSPAKRGHETPQSSTNRVSELILQSCRSKDSEARISSILRDSCGRTVVRVRAGSSSDSPSLLRVLRELWPLAKTSVVENQLDGSVEAQIIVPHAEDERVYARQRASSSKLAEFMHAAVVVLLILGVVVYMKDVCVGSAHSLVNATAAGLRGAADNREL